MRVEDEYEPRFGSAPIVKGQPTDGIPAWKGVLAIIVGTVLVLVMVSQLAWPLRTKLSQRYVLRGDQQLVSQDYEGAIHEYHQALLYDHGNALASDRIKVAEEAPTDIAVLRDFYVSHGVVAVTSKLDEALKEYPQPKDALVEGVKLYEAHDYVYARYPLEEAVKADPQYAEAWHYLGKTYNELAKLRSDYATKAKDAFAKRDALTPIYRQEK